MFQIDFKNRKAIYNQLIDNFKRLIDTGVLSPGSEVPSTSELAKMLTVNPNTVLKAYLELENQSYFESEGGTEWFVRTSSEEKDQEPIKTLYSRIHADLQLLLENGGNKEEIEQLIGMGQKSFIQVEQLKKKMDDTMALAGLTMNVKKGSIYGLVGTNGSGKTTTLRHLAGLLRPDSGIARIDGLPAYDKAHQKVIGYMPEEMYFLPDYTMKMLQRFFKNKYQQTWNNDRYQELVAVFQLNENKKINTFSRGMQKQVGFIFDISTMPDVLLLDETIDGLDPLVRKQVVKMIIEDVANREMTVLITSHNMREMDGLCDTIGIIKNGQLVIERELDELKANTHKIQLAFPQDFMMNHYPYDGLEVLYMEELGSTDLLVVRGKEEEIAQHIESFEPLVYELVPMTLEEIFIYETEGALDEVRN
ncbi:MULTISPECIES: ATP-binding cassette domain-containing protein [unclassified Enterococcus]|uniref:ATP-binding cassette domain-containing protein n=1 Tax=unclassified Enterococcus TaxID=2608891 RepID=UPI001A9AE77E|nr:ATP-binding cassette domain-containing protein [Enterococcus sp. DIV1271a]MBO1299293.1 ATP-binding cassette domain-containing protein [Enterococcus sp. DIV1271a]